MDSQKIRIKLKAYDQRLLDKSVKEIIETAKREGANVRGPIPLPTKISKYCVLRSPHVDKKSREQFEIRVHKRLIELIHPSPETVKAVMELEITSGIDFEIKQI